MIQAKLFKILPEIGIVLVAGPKQKVSSLKRQRPGDHTGPFDLQR